MLLGLCFVACLCLCIVCELLRWVVLSGSLVWVGCGVASFVTLVWFVWCLLLWFGWHGCCLVRREWLRLAGSACGFAGVVGVVVMWLRLVLVAVAGWLCFWLVAFIVWFCLLCWVVLLWFLLLGLHL